MRLVAAAALTGTLAALASSAHAAPPVDAFQAPRVAYDISPETHKAAVRRRFIASDADVLAVTRDGARRARAVVTLNLFDDVAVNATTRRFEDDGEAWTWVGRIDGEPHGTAILSREGDALAGLVRSERFGVFEIRPSGDGLSRVIELDNQVLPGCGGVHRPDDVNFEADPRAHAPAADESTPSESNAADGSLRGELPVVDILVGYTPEMRDAAGGTDDGARAVINVAITNMNTAFEDSLIQARARVVFRRALVQSEAGGGDLSDWRGTSDGRWDEIHALREAYGADVVHMIVADGDGVCGVASNILEFGQTNANRALAYCLTDIDCIAGNFTFTHENGHLLGCAHDRDATPFSGTYPFSFGFESPSLAFRTIMAVASPVQRVGLFSTPDVNGPNGMPAGAPEGQPDSADNAQTLSLNGPLYSAWLPTATLTPSGLDATTDLPGEIEVTWNNRSIVQSYRVLRATSPDLETNLTLVDEIPEGTTSVLDREVEPETTYYYAVVSRLRDQSLTEPTDPVEGMALPGANADLDGDGSVTAGDLGIVIGNWGNDGQGDLNGDGVVNAIDLGILLSAWG